MIDAISQVLIEGLALRGLTSYLGGLFINTIVPHTHESLHFRRHSTHNSH